MGRRGRRRERVSTPAGDERLTAPSSDYTDPSGNVLTLRGSLTAAARVEFMQLRSDPAGRASATREDAWQRAVELLFERLAVRWIIAGAPIDSQRELLRRFRAAGADERAWVRATLREHCAEYFPDVRAP